MSDKSVVGHSEQQSSIEQSWHDLGSNSRPSVNATLSSKIAEGHSKSHDEPHNATGVPNSQGERPDVNARPDGKEAAGRHALGTTMRDTTLTKSTHREHPQVNVSASAIEATGPITPGDAAGNLTRQQLDHTRRGPPRVNDHLHGREADRTPVVHDRHTRQTREHTPTGRPNVNDHRQDRKADHTLRMSDRNTQQLSDHRQTERPNVNNPSQAREENRSLPAHQERMWEPRPWTPELRENARRRIAEGLANFGSGLDRVRAQEASTRVREFLNHLIRGRTH